MEQLKQALSISDRNYKKLAVLFIDLDGFKKIKFSIRFSIGLSIYQDDIKIPEALVQLADKKMYEVINVKKEKKIK